MSYATLRLRWALPLLQVTLSRPAQRNAIDSLLLGELGRALDQAEAEAGCRALVLEGAEGIFCTGMDFAEAVAKTAGPAASGPGFAPQATTYMRLLGRFSESPLIVVAKVDGLVAGGGVGLVAASDLAVATPRSEFSLPEALWGLLPCCVLPYLIRRIGFQQAYRMALTTQNLSAAAARECRLVDEVAEQPEEAVRRLLLRSLRVEAPVVADLKRYLHRLQPITPEAERAAVEELCRLVARPSAREAIAGFVERGVFPWESKQEGRADG